MKLRKLELTGFKSFYEKTVFDFADGVTAIVGPNGCGKSNVVDAIRWVLGEHAPSYVRSKALLDVIFAGSDAAGPLGMAEVTLTFSNTDGFSPPGYESYAEIEITRRAFRDGESEFFINKLPCRLKDITELFLDTGAGARGYAIVEQGKIASIVAARPDEKRLIVEEAAGVAKFRVRRKEAERKMESTRQNLDRVRDIMEEVRRQLGSLERQARKAERYKVLREELKGLDYRLAYRKGARLLADAAETTALCEALEESLRQIRSDLSRLETERETARTLQAEADVERDRQEREHATLRESVARREADREARIREREDLLRLTDEMEKEARDLSAEISGLSERLSESEAAASGRTGALDGLRAARKEREAETEEARRLYEERRGAFDRARGDLMVRVQQQGSARSAVEGLHRRIEEGRGNVARLEEREREAREQSLAAEEAAGTARRLSEERRKAGEEAEGAWVEAGRSLDEVTARLEEVGGRRREVEGTHRGASSRLDALVQLYEQRDWATEGVRAVLSRKGEGREVGGAVLGILGELIETAPEHERAVEAVLGDRVQSVAVRGLADGAEALRYLKDGGAGKGTFVPVTLRARRDGRGSDGGEGVVAPLSDLVSASGDAGPMVKRLLEGVLLVSDLPSAIRLWEGEHGWSAYVTPEGDVVTGEGILSGGSAASGDVGLLARRREIRDLRREVERLSSELGRLVSEEGELRRRKEELSVLRQETFRARERCRAEAEEAARALVAREGAREQAASRLAGLKQELAFLTGEIARTGEELVRTAAAADEAEAARIAEDARVAALEASVETGRKGLEEAQGRLHAASLELNTLEEQERSARQALEALRQALEGRKGSLADRERKRTEYSGRAEALASTVEEARTAIDADLAELARRQEGIDLHREEMARLAERLQGFDSEIRGSRGRDADLSDRLSESRLALQRMTGDARNLEDLLYQRYEIRLADLPAPEGEEDEEAAEARANDLRNRMAAMGEVNLASLEEHQELSERFAFLQKERSDLEASLEDLARAIQRINRTTKERFLETFEKINEKLAEVFPKLFMGGKAYLKLLDPENLLETGVEMIAQPPGKKLLPLSMFSGGERTLMGASLIFAIFLVKPSPFCLLDEADAALDPRNVDRFNALVREMSSRYQFLLITHDRRTMELADALFGVTMERPGISRVVSVRFEAEEESA
jgi:chromosome segregation protein